ncbi:MAG TPA: TraX family protein [Clostridia bacterium]|nr:TraX family protein [Clostridia bacterium]
MEATGRLSRVNQNTNILKGVALLCMIMDHVGVAFFPEPEFIWMRVIGRIAFPLYAWCLVVGMEHTRSVPRYALRLFILFLVSQPFYMTALNHPPYWTRLGSLQFPWIKPNIFMTLLLGLAAIQGVRDRTVWPTLLAVLASLFLDADYGVRGVLCILLLYLLGDNPIALAIGYASFCVAWGESAQHILQTPWFDLRLFWGGASSAVFRNEWMTLRLQHLALLALPLMLFPMRPMPGRAPGRTLAQRLFYWAYPAHLAILWLIKRLVF